MIADMGRSYPRIAKNSKAMMIGLAEEMSVPGETKIHPCAYRSLDRIAVISLETLDPITYCEPKNDPLLELRLERALADEVLYLARMSKEPKTSTAGFLNFNSCANILNEN
jgi:hypothetical protein